MDGYKEMQQQMKELKLLEKEAICSYSVLYLRGLDEHLKHLLNIKMLVFDERLIFKDALGKQRLDLTIPYINVFDIWSEKRKVGSIAGLISLGAGGGRRDFETENNFIIHYKDSQNQEKKIRFEMVTGITIFGQAQKVDEFFSEIESFRSKFASFTETAKTDETDIASQIEKLASLNKKGIITKEEFEQKKKELLARM